jgi:hypothetical protein
MFVDIVDSMDLAETLDSERPGNCVKLAEVPGGQ